MKKLLYKIIFLCAFGALLAGPSAHAVMLAPFYETSKDVVPAPRGVSPNFSKSVNSRTSVSPEAKESIPVPPENAIEPAIEERSVNIWVWIILIGLLISIGGILFLRHSKRSTSGVIQS